MRMLRKAYADFYDFSRISFEWLSIGPFLYLIHRIFGSAIDFQLDNIDIKFRLYDNVYRPFRCVVFCFDIHT